MYTRYTLKVLFSENLKQQLDDHVEMLPVVRLVRLQERVGVVRARQQGAALATGDVLVFLDSHCECTPGNYFSAVYPLCSVTGLCSSTFKTHSVSTFLCYISTCCQPKATCQHLLLSLLAYLSMNLS